jgi:mannosyltransferase
MTATVHGVRWQHRALLVLICFGTLIRSHRLGERVIDHDEAFSWRLIQYPVGELVGRTAADVHPPLYYLLLKAWAAAWGTSLPSLRGFSVLFGGLCLPVMYLLCAELEAHGRPPGAVPHSPNAGPVFATFLAAVHVNQVTLSRDARMYALGTFLAGLTAWLLLRALRAPARWAVWWGAYGAAVAAFCYTHYYALFTVAAQALFAAGDLLIRARRGGLRPVVPAALGLVAAVASAAVLYLPWLPVVRAQIGDVQAHYWIPALTPHGLWGAVGSWATGQQGPVAGLAVLLIESLFLGTLWRAPRPAAFLLLQAAGPWALAVGISALWGTPILWERYLAFAQLPLLACWSVVWSRLPGAASRLGLAAALAAFGVYALHPSAGPAPGHRSGLVPLVEYLRNHYEPGDVIWVNGPSQVNRLRYYAGRFGRPELQVQCTPERVAGVGHVPHLSSLHAGEVAPGLGCGPSPVPRRIWTATASDDLIRSMPEGTRLVCRRTFAAGGESTTRYALLLFTRDD